MPTRKTVIRCTLISLCFAAVALATGAAYFDAQRRSTWPTGNLIFVRMPVEGEMFRRVSYVQTRDGREAHMVLASNIPFQTWYEVVKAADGRWKASTVGGKDISPLSEKMRLVALLLEAQEEAERYLAQEDLLTRPPGDG